MLAGFVFVNIPILDAHLHDHYGAAFEEYARRTRKLIPFVYGNLGTSEWETCRHGATFVR